MWVHTLHNVHHTHTHTGGGCSTHREREESFLSKNNMFHCLVLTKHNERRVRLGKKCYKEGDMDGQGEKWGTRPYGRHSVALTKVQIQPLPPVEGHSCYTELPPPRILQTKNTFWQDGAFSVLKKRVFKMRGWEDKGASVGFPGPCVGLRWSWHASWPSLG